MVPLHKFLIPRLDLYQGGAVRQMKRVECHHLQAAQNAFGAARAARFGIVLEGTKIVFDANAMGIVQTSRALAERPGRTVSSDGIVTEGFDGLLVHPAE